MCSFYYSSRITFAIIIIIIIIIIIVNKDIFYLIFRRFLGLRAMRRERETSGLLPLAVNPCSICLKTATFAVADAGET